MKNEKASIIAADLVIKLVIVLFSQFGYIVECLFMN